MRKLFKSPDFIVSVSAVILLGGGCFAIYLVNGW